MTPILFYDTETTGLPLFREKSSDPRQPHIVQAAAILADEDSRAEIASFNLIVRPDGWEIPDEVAKIHGITTAYAHAHGIPEQQVVSSVLGLAQVAGLRVGHNESFDARILRIAIKRFVNDEVADVWKQGQAECTANLATPIVKAKPTEAMRATGRLGPKKPKLSEAYEFFTGQKLENAHSAMADTRACMAVYWAIKDGKAKVGGKPGDKSGAKAAAPGNDDVAFL